MEKIAEEYKDILTVGSVNIDNEQELARQERIEVVPTLGLYGACSTMALSLAMAALSVDSGAARIAAAATSSHFCSAEKQFRTPLEYGGQRPPTAQWTATAAGCAVIGKSASPHIELATFGKITDYGVKDANNMGAAMAPAAFDTLRAVFRDTGTSPKDYDLIVTGDLGAVGSDILTELFRREGMTLDNYTDCGLLLYDRKNRCVVGVHMVGSYVSEIIYGAAMMVHSKLPVQHLDKIVFPHPTVGEVVREALFLL